MNIIYFIHELNDIFILSLGYIFTLIGNFFPVIFVFIIPLL